jgi:hypothetical protein
VPDPVPTGRQILASAGLDHRADYILFAYLNTGDFEDVRLDETFDLRGKGAERFIAFKSDRDFKFSMNDRQLAWGRAEILGSVLYDLADAAPDEAVFLEVRGGEDRLIDPDERINLDAPASSASSPRSSRIRATSSWSTLRRSPCRTSTSPSSRWSSCTTRMRAARRTSSSR